MTNPLIRRGFAAVLAACPILVASGGADAAVGSVEFQKFDVRLSDANRGPHLPVITVQLIDGKWRVSPLPVEFVLAIHVKVNTLSRISRIVIGVPGVNVPSNTWQAFSSQFEEGSREVRIDTRGSVPGDRLALVSLDAATRCAQALAGKNGDFTLPFRIPVEVHVAAQHGIF